MAARFTRWAIAMAGVIGAAAEFAVLDSPLLAAPPDTSASAPQTIRKITIVRENVFSPHERRVGILGDTGWLIEHRLGRHLADFLGPKHLDVAGLANRLHFKTVPGVIERDLLFAPGQTLDYSMLEETERNLRALRFMRNATVSTSNPDSEHADIIVHTQDSWTLIPRLDFSLLGGGHTTGAAGIEEDNLFGLGKQAEFIHRKRLYRSSDDLLYDDAQVWGSHWHLNTILGKATDGRNLRGLIEYPFWAQEVPNAIGVSASDVVDRERLFSQNQAPFRHAQRDYSMYLAHALVASSELVRRVEVKFDRSVDQFSHTASDFPQPLNLRNRRTSLFGVDLLEWHPDFIKAYYLDQLGHPEDRDLGSTFRLGVGYSPAALGATRSEASFNALWNSGGRIDDGGYLWLGGQIAGFQGSGQLRRTIASLETIAYQHVRLLRDQTLVFDTRLDWSAGLPRDQELLIGGGDGGLRGYPINRFSGSRRLLFHLEDRVLFAEDLFHLISLGGVAFADSGAVWGLGHNFSAGAFLASVGVGLRFAATRSGRQIPFRIDFAIPIIRGHGISPFDISSGSGQAFEPFASPFAAQDNATNSEL